MVDVNYALNKTYKIGRYMLTGLDLQRLAYPDGWLDDTVKYGFSYQIVLIQQSGTDLLILRGITPDLRNCKHY